jgi:hypothetical protein
LGALEIGIDFAASCQWDMLGSQGRTGSKNATGKLLYQISNRERKRSDNAHAPHCHAPDRNPPMSYTY